MDSREPIDWQEAHSPTAPTEIVISHTPRRVKAGPRRRILEKRLWEGLTEEERAAATEIDRAWLCITGGLAARAQQFERVDKGIGSVAETESIIRQTYDNWRGQLTNEARSACIAVICENAAMQQVAKAYRKSNGWPRHNLGLCLRKWIEIRGWA